LVSLVHDSSWAVEEVRIAMLDWLPSSMHAAVAMEAFAPLLCSNHFLRSFVCSDPDLEYLHRLVTDICVEVWLDSRELLFQKRCKATAMTFIVSGELAYGQRELEEDAIIMDSLEASLHAGDSVCEHALWLEWRHLGDAIMCTKSQLVMVKASLFHDFVREWPCANVFAAQYCLALQGLMDSMAGLTDLPLKESVLKESVKDAFGHESSLEDFDYFFGKAILRTLNMSPKLMAFQQLDMGFMMTESSSMPTGIKDSASRSLEPVRVRTIDL
jgi:hypothetical protein